MLYGWPTRSMTDGRTLYSDSWIKRRRKLYRLVLATRESTPVYISRYLIKLAAHCAFCKRSFWHVSHTDSFWRRWYNLWLRRFCKPRRWEVQQAWRCFCSGPCFVWRFARLISLGSEENCTKNVFMGIGKLCSIIGHLFCQLLSKAMEGNRRLHLPISTVHMAFRHLPSKLPSRLNTATSGNQFFRFRWAISPSFCGVPVILPINISSFTSSIESRPCPLLGQAEN